MKRLAPYLAGGVIALLLAFVVRPAPKEESNLPAIVTITRLVRGEPDTAWRFRDRISYVKAKPVITESAPGGGVPNINDFCTAAGWAPAPATAEADSGLSAPPQPAPPQLLLRSVETSTPFPRLLRKERVTAIGPMAGGAGGGSLERREYNVRAGSSIRTNGDSLIVRSPRFGMVKDLLELVMWIGTGVVFGATAF